MGSCLSYYPGTGCRRIRWDSQEFEPVTASVMKEVRSHACYSIKEAVKAAKNELKNTLSNSFNMIKHKINL